jgi:general secretion pathway protein G
MKLTTLRRNATRRSAFTLLEVLVVVAILVILASVATIATTRYLDDAKKSKAHLQAQGLAQACEGYNMQAANPGAGTAEGYPENLGLLLNPPFGQAFLKNGEDDLKTPWGTQWNYEVRHRQGDNQPYVYIWTEAPDKTKISNFGVGQKADPTNP